MAQEQVVAVISQEQMAEARLLAIQRAALDSRPFYDLLVTALRELNAVDERVQESRWVDIGDFQCRLANGSAGPVLVERR